MMIDRWRRRGGQISEQSLRRRCNLSDPWWRWCGTNKHSFIFVL